MIIGSDPPPERLDANSLDQDLRPQRMVAEAILRVPDNFLGLRHCRAPSSNVPLKLGIENNLKRETWVLFCSTNMVLLDIIQLTRSLSSTFEGGVARSSASLFSSVPLPVTGV